MGVFEQFPYTNFHDMNDAWVLKIVKECAAAVDDMEEWKSQHQEEYQELKEFMDNINAGNFPDSMYDTMRTWFEANALDLVGSMIKHVHFGLTNDGYFCAFIPNNWSNVQFDTITDFNDPLYGHLVLMYD